MNRPNNHRTALLLASMFFLNASVIEAAEPTRFSYRAQLEVQTSHADSLRSWLNEGSGKLRFDEDDNGKLQPGSIGFDWQYAVNNTGKLKGTVIYNDDPDQELAATELYWHARPVPHSHWRSDYRLGAFYAPLSLENKGPLWTSSYSITPSVINSWIGEELRTIGAQGRWTLMGRHRGSPNDFTLTAALFGGNDTTGALIAWRGWAKSDRQTGLGQAVPLQALPVLKQGEIFEKQEQEIAPFKETDHRPGFYLGGEWRHQRKFRLAMLYYDNQADSKAIHNGQYAWHTHFGHIASHWQLSPQWQLLGQYIDGSTKMGRYSQVYAPFKAGYLMLVHTTGRQRWSLQWENFSVDDKDQTLMDSNGEDGDSLNLAWRYQQNKHWHYSAQLSRTRSDRDQRHYSGDDTSVKESQLLGSIRYIW